MHCSDERVNLVHCAGSPCAWLGCPALQAKRIRRERLLPTMTAHETGASLPRASAGLASPVSTLVNMTVARVGPSRGRITSSTSDGPTGGRCRALVVRVSILGAERGLCGFHGCGRSGTERVAGTQRPKAMLRPRSWRLANSETR